MNRPGKRLSKQEITSVLKIFGGNVHDFFSGWFMGAQAVREEESARSSAQSSDRAGL